MLLEKWSTSYLSSAALKHNPHRAKLQITATNSLGSIAPRFRGGRGAPGGAGQGRAGPGGAAPALRDGRAHPALTSPAIPGHSRPQPRRPRTGDTPSAPSSHATSAHRAPCAHELGTDAQRTKNLLFISSGQSVYC